MNECDICDLCVCVCVCGSVLRFEWGTVGKCSIQNKHACISLSFLCLPEQNKIPLVTQFFKIETARAMSRRRDLNRGKPVSDTAVPATRANP
jgi:hypothetical protein